MIILYHGKIDFSKITQLIEHQSQNWNHILIPCPISFQLHPNPYISLSNFKAQVSESPRIQHESFDYGTMSEALSDSQGNYESPQVPNQLPFIPLTFNPLETLFALNYLDHFYGITISLPVNPTYFPNYCPFR